MNVYIVTSHEFSLGGEDMEILAAFSDVVSAVKYAEAIETISFDNSVETICRIYEAPLGDASTNSMVSSVGEVDRDTWKIFATREEKPKNV